MDILTATTFGINQLKHLKNPRLETEILLSITLNKDRVFLKTNPNFLLSKAEQISFQRQIKKRAQNIPIAYILGYKDWNGIRVSVTESVLIPRDETEILCAYILKSKELKSSLTLLDIGTGSGCIPLFITQKLKYKKIELKISALDISSKALLVAKQNFDRFKIKANLIQSDLLEKIPDHSHFDLITANLPYVPVDAPVSKDLSYEPQKAIFSGHDGLDHIRRLADQLKKKNIRFKTLWLEFLPRQQLQIAEIFADYRKDFLTDVGGEIFFVKIRPHD